MKSARIAVAFAALVITIAGDSSMAQNVFEVKGERAYSVPNADAPELAPLGAFEVGVTEISFTDSARANIVEALAGRPPVAPRDIPVTIWFPAQNTTSRSPATYTGKLNFRPGTRPPEVPETYRYSGLANTLAEPVTGQKFPLIIISHGYGNWAAFLSYLGENLASKGYIVASIEHNDLPYTDLASFNISFGNTMLNRSRDQRFVIESLLALATGKHPIGSLIDKSSVGLIGYSMGGFGALASAGAGYTHDSPSLNQIPPAMLTGLLADNNFIEPHPALKAVVAIAPWGGAPANRAWSTKALANIELPMLFISGDQDDVSGFDEGIKWLYEAAIASDRHMLVFENGRHSIGGNPEPPFSHDYFDMADWFNEPVWRRDRVVGINQHFITAYMNFHLKQEKTAADFINVAPTRSNDGEWPIPPGGYTGSAYSGGQHDGKDYWKGFQRRWALGLQMHRAAPK